MRFDQNDFIVSQDEAATLAAAYAAIPGPLSALPPATPGTRPDPRWLEGVPAAARDDLRRAVAQLADPVKRLELHTAITDETISRVTLAWGREDGGQCGLLARAGGERRLGMRSAGEVRVMLMSALAATAAIAPLPLRLGLSTAAALTFLAVVDQLRLARLVSLIKHVAPIEVFSLADLEARFAAAEAEDFRWPLNFLDKLLPLPLAKLDLAHDLPAALAELETRRLVARVTEGSSPTYEVAPEGALLAKTLLHEVSRAGLSVTARVTAEVVVHDVALLVRSAQHLVLFYLTGREAAIRFLDAPELEAWLSGILAFVPPPPAEPAEDKTVVLPAKRADDQPTVVLAVPAERLQVAALDGVHSGQTFGIDDGGTVGRQAESAIVLAEPGVSRRHARFSRLAAGWAVEDLKTPNGTFLNDVRVAGPTPLHVGDTVRIGTTHLRVTEV